MDKILILGINGFTGKHFQEYIGKNNLSEKYSFIGIDIIHSMPKTNIEIINADFSTYNNIEDILNEYKPDYIINLIGMFHSENLERLIEVNANISMNIFDVIVRRNLQVKKTLLIGTAAEYGISENLPIMEETPLNPVNFYGLSKVVQYNYMKYYIRNYNLKIDMARTFNVVGQGLSPNLSIASFVNQCRQAKDGDSIYVGNLDSKRDFIDIADAVDAYWKILCLPSSGNIYNVCSGKSHSIRELLDYLVKKSGKEINVEIKPEYIKKNDIPDSHGCKKKLSENTGWKPKHDIYKSLDKMIAP
jgi:GDP-4-dehydro-6-deoxy-D-mannose reductase